MKNNLGNDKIGDIFKIETCLLESNIETSRVIWLDEEITITINEAMVPGFYNEYKGALNEAKEFLCSVLEDGAKSSNEIKKKAREAGIAQKTLNRAKKDLEIKSIKDGMRGGWIWELPQKPAIFPEDGH